MYIICKWFGWCCVRILMLCVFLYGLCVEFWFEIIFVIVKVFVVLVVFNVISNIFLYFMFMLMYIKYIKLCIVEEYYKDMLNYIND